MPDNRIRINADFWKGKNVFVTGHTGFKGTWLSLWLQGMGANVTGYSLQPPTEPSLFELCRMKDVVSSYIADIRDMTALSEAIVEAAPDIVFHLAAQPLVRASYLNPIETYEINTMGTIHLLEAVRQAKRNNAPIKAVIHVSTDKVYSQLDEERGYREDDRLGGGDPYSNSKALTELIVTSYRQMFEKEEQAWAVPVALASARAGNVIGGGDWAEDRLIPDCFRAILQDEPVKLRYPQAVRPWQHVLEPLHGYLLLAQHVYDDKQYAAAWNFGPNEEDTISVEQVVCSLCQKWGDQAAYLIDSAEHPHEAPVLRLDCTKSRDLLGWSPRWNLDMAITKSIEWVKAYDQSGDCREICSKQIQEYVEGSEQRDH
ncbi:CDP-glucose 4,6-dehydratase [Paenibacillus sp. CGMCC 1.16610]|uniref:CDP-glucose 4,6-dehydratase n=1 Tax=Paenibacillus anseongense TaxID=2682845 RepID=A0ABW9U1Y0_9BACL|nr:MULTISPECIES: CDP-glucose 4,6-dehydratase [Paenibacillus]MBA2940905.1 CDP-glucose 4,6-dehydratase [Paenibacillus sp. CGMCC 1.16610]MVQ34089.1 CDP-glucose 4,6-dehydratase [Paenibacillus anseongense]